MHEHTGYPCLSYDRGHFRVVFQPPDVIDQIRPCRKPGFCHAGFIGIKGNRHVKAALYGLYDRYYPPDFFLLGHKGIAGSCRLSSDIQNIHSFVQHLFHLKKGMIRLLVSAPV